MPEKLISITVPVRIISSHGINRPSFEANSKGIFFAKNSESLGSVDRVSITNINILGVAVEKLEISEPTDGWQMMNVVFSEPHSNGAIYTFIQSFTDALTATFAPNQKDAWNGNLYIDINWSSLLGTPPSAATPGLHLQDSLSISAETHQTLTPEDLTSLNNSYFVEIFVDGMRSNRPRAKYISWFIMLEELESFARKQKLPITSTPLFSQEEQVKIVENSGLTDTKLDRLKGFLTNPNLTLENRSKKLSDILHYIGIKEMIVMGRGKIKITPELCEKIINMRNKISHKGRSVDEVLLYNVLFPLAHRVMDYLSKALSVK